MGERRDYSLTGRDAQRAVESGLFGSPSLAGREASPLGKECLFQRFGEPELLIAPLVADCQRVVEPGDQPRLIRELAWEAIRFVEGNDLITIPEMAVDPWLCWIMTGAKPRPSSGLPKLG